MPNQRTLECFDPADLKLKWSSRRSRSPNTLEELQACTDVVLGHVTDSNYLASIIVNGLIPDPERNRGISDGLPSDGNCVYLMAKLDTHYFGRNRHRGDCAIVVVVEVERTSLNADENWVSEGTAGDPGQLLYISLCGGACKHIGPITPECLTAVYSESGALLLDQSHLADLRSRSRVELDALLPSILDKAFKGEL